MESAAQIRRPGLVRRLKEGWPAWFEPLLARDRRDAAAVLRGPVRRILVVRQHDQLGDFLLATPALRALRSRYPDAHLAIVVRSYFAAAAGLVPFVDEVLVVRENAAHWSLASFRAFWRALRAPWDLAVVFTTVSHSATSDVVAALARPRLAVGSAGRLFPGTTRNYFYDVEAPVVPGERHQSERNIDIVRAIGCDTADLREEIRVRAADRGSVEAAHPRRGMRRVGLHLGAGKVPNRWPAERFAALAVLLGAGAPTEILLFWGPAEGALKDAYVAHAPAGAALVGPQPVPLLAAYFRSCDLMVCNDTGVLHLAAATGVPTVALFGPTDPAAWAPAGEHVRALRGEGGEVGAIEPAAVAAASEELLRRFPLVVHHAE